MRTIFFISAFLMLGLSLPLAQAQDKPIGYASVNGMTTGGAGGKTVKVSTLAALKSALSSSDKLIIEVSGKISGKEGLRVKSNKTIIGKKGATLDGVGLLMYTVNNIIVRNIKFINAAASDAITIKSKSHHIWVDHCEISNVKFDGGLDVTNGSDYVTVSWNIFSGNNKNSLVAGGPDNPDDEGKLHVTYHHNFFLNNDERSPSYGTGQGHVFNNYYLRTDGRSSYGVASRYGAIVHVENNYFENVANPLINVTKDPEWGFFSGEETNFYKNASTNKIRTQPKKLTPPYAYKHVLLPVAQVPAAVKKYAGPQDKLDTTPTPAPAPVPAPERPESPQKALCKPDEMEVRLDLSKATHDDGHAYAIKGQGLTVGDTNSDKDASNLRLFENNKPLGPAHSLHADIRKKGMGRYSHKNSVLRLSSSDKSDPRKNGRKYVYCLSSKQSEEDSDEEKPSTPSKPAEPSVPNTPPIQNEPMPGAGQIIGFAAMGTGTTGGAGGKTVRVSTLTELKKALSSSEKLIVEVSGKITGKEGVRVKSNKTIIGVNGATLDGVGLLMYTVNNIIVRNIKFINAAASDAITIKNKSHHIWVDHCEISDVQYDGGLDVTNGSDYVTVSWNIFSGNNKNSLVAGGPNNPDDQGKLHVTYHHNLFLNNDERSPSYGTGEGHVFNNYYLRTDGQSSYGVASRYGAIVHVENNYFENIANPLINVTKDPEWGFFSGEETNFYKNASTNKIRTKAKKLTPPYAYKHVLLPVAQVPALVKRYAGPQSNLDNSSPPSSPSPTPVPEPVIYPEIVSQEVRDITETSVKISWKLSHGANGRVDYGTSSSLGQSSKLEKGLLTAHVQTLSALKPGTTYYYRIRSKDGKGKEVVSEVKTFTTEASAPVITFEATEQITENSVKIHWKLDQSASGQIEYGTTSSLGTKSKLEKGLLKEHIQQLKGLKEGTTYHYKILSLDAKGKAAASQVKTFKTLMGAPVITDQSVAEITDTTANIRWKLNHGASGQVEYGTSSRLGLKGKLVSTLLPEHDVKISGLKPTTTYYYRVRSKNSNGKEVVSAVKTFKTLTPAPEILAQKADAVTDKSARIRWRLNKPASGVVSYGPTQAMGQVKKVDVLKQEHIMILEGLKESTTYYYQLRSQDNDKREVVSPVSKFVTAAIPGPKISQQSVDNITSTSVEIKWKLDKPATGQIAFGASTKYGMHSKLEDEFLLEHTQKLVDLKPNTTYHFIIRSKDSKGKEVVSKDATFKTLPSIQKIYPPDVKMSKAPYVAPKSVPGYLKPFIDPLFGNLITRISDSRYMSDSTMQHHYSKDQPWNRDGSLIKLSSSTPAILDGRTYKLLYTKRMLGQSLWSNVDPNILYGTNGKNLAKMNVKTGEVTNLYSFADYNAFYLGPYEGNISNDDRYFPIMAKSGKEFIFMIYDQVKDKITGTLDVGQNEPDWISISQSGKYAVVSWKEEGSGPHAGMKVYDNQLNFLRHLSDRNPHGDLCYDTDGNEVYVGYYGSSKVGPWMYRLDNGKQTVIMPFRLSGGHVSCRNIDRPGWAYLSDGGHQSGPAKFVGYREIFAVKLDGSGTSERFAQHHSDNDLGGYYAEAHAVPNHDGTKVMFKSNWNNLTRTPKAPSWVVEVPQNKKK